MTRETLTGSRIRARRLDLGLKQADVARACDISPSYLNLIEHNRRRIGGKLLAQIARVLEVEAAALSQGAGAALTGALEAAAARQPGVAAEADRAEEFAGRFPGWARLVEEQERRVEGLERLVEALNDRLTHDPLLGSAMHEVLSAATAIRSTSGILAGGETVDPEWQARFHRNLYEDSQRLAEAAAALLGYLDTETENASAAALTPQEELEAWLAANDWRIPALDRALAPNVDAVLDAARGAFSSVAARSVARRWIARYAEDARRIPAAALDRAGEEAVDPAALAARQSTDLATALRRIGSLVPQAGLVLCDGSGTLTFRKPADGFDVPRFGSSCPLWPLYEALQRPMTPVRALIEMPGPPARRFTAYALSMSHHPEGFDGPAVVEATMLVLPQPGGDGRAAQPVGASCRVCPRDGCTARREPSILGRGL